MLCNRGAPWPIEEDGTGWDHVRRVDDAVIDGVAALGRTVFRAGPTLVVDFGDAA